jgi:hypothetical protein
MRARKSRLVSAPLWLASSFALYQCAPLIGLDEDYYVAVERAGAGGDGNQAGTTPQAGSAGALGGSSAGVTNAGNAGDGGEPPVIAGAGGGVGGAGGMGSELPVIPDGKLVYHRYTAYATGDSEMFVVSFPSLEVSPDIRETYDLCNPINGIFSPDGDWLAVTAEPPSDTCGPTTESQQDVYLLDLVNPPNKVKVTGNTLPDEDPQFSPDGGFLVFKHNKHLAKWDIGGAAFTDCVAPPTGSFCFTPSSGTTTQQSKPVLTPDGETLCYYELFGPDADIRCIALADALVGDDITLDSTAIVAHDDISDARPNFSGGQHLYYVRWQSAEIKIDQIVRRPLADLQGVDSFPKFATDLASDYSDPFSIDGDLVIFASDITGMGKHDLFIGDWGSDAPVHSLNDWIPGINSAKDDLGGVFWAAP